MGESLIMDVFDALQNGAENESDASVRNLRLPNNNVEEFSSNDVVEHKEVASVRLATVGRIEDSTFAVVVHFNDVLMVEFAISIQLLSETISCVGLEHLHCVGLSVLLALVDRAVGAFADGCAVERVATKCVRCLL